MDMVSMAKRGSALAGKALDAAKDATTAAATAGVRDDVPRRSFGTPRHRSRSPSSNRPSDPLDVEETEKLFVKQKIETMEAVANAVAGAVGLGEFAALGEAANKCGGVPRATAAGRLPIGKVTKEGATGELVQQSLTDADNFVLNFPKDTDKKTKAAMLSSLLLLEYMFFEDEGALACDPVNCACKFKCCDLYRRLTPRSCSCGEPAPPPPATGL
ncbi:hypothetical protein JL720_7104 [Aureococcus anophagefferens]|nr:hypothetical protein JL720_7104 [Aureococcus anophagefferens]